MSQAMGEVPAMLPPGMWEREARLRWTTPVGTESMSISGVSSSHSIASARSESPEPPPLVLESLLEEGEEPGLMDPSGFARSDSPEKRASEMTPTKFGSVPDESREVRIVQERTDNLFQRLEVTLPGDLMREAVTMRPQKRSVEEWSPPPSARNLETGSKEVKVAEKSPEKTGVEKAGEAGAEATKTTGTTKKPGQTPLVAQAYHQQAEFTIPTPDPRATSLEDQRKMKTAYEPSPRYVESRTAADRHLKSLASIEAKDVPHWVLLMSKRMKDAPKEEHPYLAGKKESNDQMPGRTDSWELHQPGFQSLIKLTMENMRAARVVIFVDSTLRPVPEQGYLLADVVKVVLPGSSLKQMHAVADYFMRHVVAPDVFVFSNLVDDLETKGMLQDVLTDKEGAVARALSSQVEDIELIRRRVRESSRNRTQVPFASPPGFVFWKSKTLQMLTYALWEVSSFGEERQGRGAIPLSNLCSQLEDSLGIDATPGVGVPRLLLRD